MGNACGRGSAASSSSWHGGTAPVRRGSQQHVDADADPRAYFDSLLGPADGAGASPYHPHGERPVRVPTLFELALEQLCVSLVDEQSLHQLVAAQQRRRRGSLRPPAQSDTHRDADADSEADAAGRGADLSPEDVESGSASVSTPTTPLAAAVWSTAALQRGAAGATRRYSHADVWMQQRLRMDTRSHKRAPLAAHHAPWCGPQPYGAMQAALPGPHTRSPHPLKRTRSLSLSSKESPELQPQSYGSPFAGTAASTRRTSLQPRSPTSPSMPPSYAMATSRGSASSGNSPLPNALRAALHVPASPLVLGMSHTPAPRMSTPHGSRSAHMAAVPPPLLRSLSDPLAPGSAPQPVTRSEFDPPELLLPPTHSSSVIHPTHGRSGVDHASLDSQGHHVGPGLSTSALLAAGSMSLAVGGAGGRSWCSRPTASTGRSLLHQQLRLPDSIVQLIFDRMVSEELLTIDNIRLFTSAHLGSIDLSGRGGAADWDRAAADAASSGGNGGKYASEVTDEWMHVLFEGVVEHYSRMQYVCQQQQEERARAKQQLAAQQVPTHTSSDPITTVADHGQRVAPISLAAEERKESESESAPRSSSATTSPNLVAQTRSPHHGSIAHLSLERQQNVRSHLADGNGSTPKSPPRSQLTPHSAPQTTRSLVSTFAHSASPSHCQAPSFAAGSLPSIDLPLLSVHNPLSVTSPSPSLALYSHAPSLTALNLSGCSQLSNRSLMPLQLCLMLRRLNLSGCTQISDELLMCVLQNKFFIESVQLKGLRAVTDQTVEVLSDKGYLRVLELDCCSITDAGLQKLAPLSQLQRFSVGWCGKRVTEKGIQWIAHNFGLQSLCIAFTGVGSTGFFSHLRMLREVNVSGLAIADGGLKHSLFPHLRHAYVQRTRFLEVPAGLLHFHLRTLDMSFSSSVASGKLVHQLAAWVESKPHQSTMAPAGASTPFVTASGVNATIAPPILPGSDASVSSASTLAASASTSQLASFTSHLSSSNSLRPDAADASSSPDSHPPTLAPLPQSAPTQVAPPAAEVLRPMPLARGSDASCIQVRRLWLEGCGVNNRAARLIGEHMRNLTSLNLADTDVGNDGVQALAPLSRLRVLNLSGCKITNAALATIGSHFPRLLELHLDCPTVSDAGLASLRPLAPHLERLDLFEAHISDGGLEHLAGFVRLLALECCCGRLTNKGVAAVGRHLRSLTSLNLSHNVSIDDEGVEALRPLHKLVHLNLSGTKVTHKGLALLTSATNTADKHADSAGTRSPSVSLSVPPLQRISLFGCDVKATSGKLAQLPPGLQLGIDAGVLVVE